MNDCFGETLEPTFIVQPAFDCALFGNSGQILLSERVSVTGIENKLNSENNDVINDETMLNK